MRSHFFGVDLCLPADDVGGPAVKGVLGDKGLRELNETGFVRTGIVLPGSVVSRVYEMYRRMPASDSNWSFFELNSLANEVQGWRGTARQLVRNWAPWLVHFRVRKTIYDKSIYGSSDALPIVLRECLSQGLAGYLGDIPLLVGHDIYLEHDRHKSTFGFHEDGFGWDIFFQTGDDLSLYIPLQDLTEGTGGRLVVERHANKSVRYGERNEMMRRFAAYCREHEAVDHRGLVTREAVQESPNRHIIARELVRLIRQRGSLPTPSAEVMHPIDAVEGEVILFNNKCFHNVEAWNLDAHRAIYIVRCFPVYDLGLAPPSTFLNDIPCNRFVIDGCRGTLRAINCDMDMPHFVPVPH